MKNLLTSPFGLEDRLKPLGKNYNVFALLNIGLIALGFFLLSSRFILAPGVLIELPTVNAKSALGIVVYDVLTINQQNMMLFDGRIYNLDTLFAALNRSKQQAQTSSESQVDNTGSILLVKMDKNTSMDVFLRVCEISYKAGYTQIQIAALPEAEHNFPGFGSFSSVPSGPRER